MPTETVPLVTLHCIVVIIICISSLLVVYRPLPFSSGVGFEVPRAGRMTFLTVSLPFPACGIWWDTPFVPLHRLLVILTLPKHRIDVLNLWWAAWRSVNPSTDDITLIRPMDLSAFVVDVSLSGWSSGSTYFCNYVGTWDVLSITLLTGAWWALGSSPNSFLMNLSHHKHVPQSHWLGVGGVRAVRSFTWRYGGCFVIPAIRWRLHHFVQSRLLSVADWETYLYFSYCLDGFLFEATTCL